MPSVSTGAPPDAPIIIIPPEAVPASPWGIAWWRSRALVAPLISAGFGLLAAVATLLRALGFGDVAAAIEAGAGQINQAQLIDAVLTLSQAIGAVGSIIAGITAARARDNGGRALSPIARTLPLLRRTTPLAILLLLAGCMGGGGYVPTAAQAVREARQAACALYLTQYEAADLTRLSDADLGRAEADVRRWRPVCTGTAPTLAADPDAIRAATAWLMTAIGARQ